MTTLLLDQAESVLRQDGFSTRRISIDHAGDVRSVVLFEDASLIGVVAAFDTADGLQASWHEMQNAFVRTYAARLRLDHGKAWSMYFVVLTSEELSTTKQFAISAIEEDLRISRKIARSGVRTRSDVFRALATVRQISPQVSASSAHSRDAVSAKLSEEDNRILALLQSGNPESIVSWFDSVGNS